MSCMFEWAWGSLHSVTQTLRPVNSVLLRHASLSGAVCPAMCEQKTSVSVCVCKREGDPIIHCVHLF